MRAASMESPQIGDLIKILLLKLMLMLMLMVTLRVLFLFKLLVYWWLRELGRSYVLLFLMLTLMLRVRVFFSKPMVVLRSLVGVLCSGQEVYLPPPERNVKGDSANGTQPMSQTLCFPRKEHKSSK